MNCRLVLFDFDGTLADSVAWFVQAFNETAADYHFNPLTPENAARIRTLGPVQIMSELGVPRWRLPLVARRLRAKMESEEAPVALFGGVEEMLRTLHGRGVALGVVSSNSTQTIRRVLGPRNESLISHCEGGVSLFGKAGKIRKVVKQAGVPPGSALYVGDEIRDIQAARNAGVDAAAVAWGYNDPKTLQALRPDLFFARVEDIALKIGA